MYFRNPVVLHVHDEQHNMPPDWSEDWMLYCAVNFFSVIEASKRVTIEVESHSQTPDDLNLVCNDYVPIIMTTFTTYTTSSMHLLRTWSSFHLNSIIWLHPVVSPGECMWVHLHPIYAPVHPSYACVVLFTYSLRTCSCHSMHVSLQDSQ